MEEKELIDRNGIKIKAGDVIDIHQTVNGCPYFIVLSLEPLEVRYWYDNKIQYPYEYDALELLDANTDIKTISVVGNIYKNFLQNSQIE